MMANHSLLLRTTLGALALLVCLASSADAQLISRLAGQAVYDADRDISWIADANLALTNQFGLALSGSQFDSTPNTVGSTGLMTWDNANAWIAGMNAANYLGFNDWRLPVTAVPDINCTGDDAATTPVAGPPGFHCTGSEMGHLVYDEFGGTPGTDLMLTADPIELAKFTNLGPGVSHFSWSSTEWALSPVEFAWAFEFGNGQESNNAKVNSLFAIAVRSGDVGAAAPVPAIGLPGLIIMTIGLLASGAVAMLGREKRGR